MSRHFRLDTACAAVLALWSGPRAEGGITFCNLSQHDTYFAVAYQTAGGEWQSRGWLLVNIGEGQRFDGLPPVPTFYWRGETDWFVGSDGQRQWAAWGGKKGRSFTVGTYPFGSFFFRNADVPDPNGRKELMERFPVDDVTGDISAKVTLNADGSFISQSK